MDILRLTVLLLQLVGLAVLLGGFLAQLRREHRIGSVLLTGAIIMMVTGPSLVVVRHALELPVFEAKIATKAALAALIAVVAVVGWIQRRWSSAYYIVGLLTLANLAVAFFWR